MNGLFSEVERGVGGESVEFNNKGKSIQDPIMAVQLNASLAEVDRLESILFQREQSI